MKDLTSQQWDIDVLQSTAPVVVEFWAPWCSWCRQLTPEFEALASEYGGMLRFAKLNADDHPDVAEKYHVLGLPTIKIFCEGQIIGELVGYMPKTRLRLQIERHIQSHRECIRADS